MPASKSVLADLTNTLSLLRMGVARLGTSEESRHEAKKGHGRVSSLANPDANPFQKWRSQRPSGYKSRSKPGFSGPISRLVNKKGPTVCGALRAHPHCV